MRSVRVILPCVLTAAGLAAWNTPISNTPPHAVRRTSPHAVHGTAGRDSALDGRLRVPAGFKVTYYANGLPGVRFMVVGPDKMPSRRDGFAPRAPSHTSPRTSCPAGRSSIRWDASGSRPTSPGRWPGWSTPPART